MSAQITPEFQPYLRPRQIQRLYGINAATIRSWFSQGKIAGAKLGKIILINHAEFLNKIKRIENGEATNVF
jgi:predicted site-specific integrase-resolvase